MLFLQNKFYYLKKGKFLKNMGQLTPIQTGGVTTAVPQFPQQWGNDNAIVNGGEKMCQMAA